MTPEDKDDIVDRDKNDNGGDKKSEPAGLRNVVSLGLVSFFTDFSTEMVLGYFPFSWLAIWGYHGLSLVR